MIYFFIGYLLGGIIGVGIFSCIVLANRTDNKEYIYTELLKEKDEWENEYYVLLETNEELNNVIKQAIDYIEMIQYNETYGVEEKDYIELLDILKGVENE